MRERLRKRQSERKETRPAMAAETETWDPTEKRGREGQQPSVGQWDPGAGGLTSLTLGWGRGTPFGL